MSPAAVSVGRVRVQDVRHDPLATRVALDRLLTTAALRPRGLAPAAILVVRALRDPLPRRLRLDRFGVRPPPEWEHAVANSLDDLARGAARPAHEAVGANAAAVLFADRAELLACLLADWAAGAIASRWWWRLVVRGAPEVAVPAELRASPTYVPAAFAALAERGAAVAVAAALPPDEALATAQSVAAAFGIPVPHVVEPQAEKPTATAARGLRSERVTREQDVPPASPAWSAVVANLLPAVPEARASGLHAEQRLLLAVALGLRRVPAALRLPTGPVPEEPTSAREPAPAAPQPAGEHRPAEGRVRAPASAAGTVPAPRPDAGPISESGAGPPSEEPPHAGPPVEEPTAQEPAAAPPGTSPGSPTPGAERPIARMEPAIEPPGGAQTQEEEPAPPPRATAAPEPQQTRAAVPARDVATTARADPARAAPPPRHEPDTEGVPLLGPAVETRFGGLFFLVNVAVDLGLYGDFTQPARPGIALDLWDFLTLAGRRLVRGARDDAVWPLLAELAGRDPADPPGAGFVPPGGLTLPDWTNARVEEIRLLLAEADLPPRRLLRRPAAVHVTEAHLDVVFALAGHPLEIRIAGLDRDPGFVPAAGRHVAFHFE